MCFYLLKRRATFLFYKNVFFYARRTAQCAVACAAGTTARGAVEAARHSLLCAQCKITVAKILFGCMMAVINYS